MQVPFDADEDERRRRLLNACLITLAAVGVLGAAITTIAIPLGAAGDIAEITVLYGSILFVWLAVGGIYWVSRRHSRLACWLFLFLVFLMGVISDTPYYVVQGRTLVLFALPVALASVLLHPFASFIFAAAATVASGVFALRVGVVPNPGLVVLLMLAMIMALVMQNLDRILAEWRRATYRLELVNKAGRLLGANLTLDEVLVSTLDEVCDLLGVTYASIWSLDSEADELVCWQATGASRDLLVGRRIPCDKGLIGWVLRTGQGVVVDDLQEDSRHCVDLDRLLDEEIRSVLCLPLRVSDRIIGVLDVRDSARGRFEPTDPRLVEPLATSAAVAIENARLYEETDRLRVFNENIVNGMQEGILMVDEYGLVTFVNPRIEELLGLASSDLIGEPWSMIIAPEELVSNCERFAQVADGVTGQYETVLASKDGRCVPVLLSSRPLQHDGKFSGMLAVVTDITALKKAEAKLRQQAGDLRERNAELDAYAHTVAHDLKSPLALMVGYADVLRMDCGSIPPEKVKTYLGYIASTGYKACSIVDELLMLSEVRTGEAVKVPIDMGKVVGAVLERVEQMTEARGADLVVPSEWPEVLGYEPWLEEVWINYVSNALKYGGPNPRVELGWDQVSIRHVRFWVRDTGNGLTDEEQARLFRSFTRLHGGKVDGHGLGLSIVLRIVQKLGGEVGVESAVGKGSTFYFTLECADRRSLEFGGEADYPAVVA